MKDFMYMDDIKLTIEGLITEYKKLQLKAMDEDDRDKVNQFTGSMISLIVLADQLGVEIKEDYGEEES